MLWPEIANGDWSQILTKKEGGGDSLNMRDWRDLFAAADLSLNEFGATSAKNEKGSFVCSAQLTSSWRQEVLNVFPTLLQLN